MVSYISSMPSQTWQTTWPRNVVLLGSTGSIGCSALEVIRREKTRFCVTALAGAHNVALLARQAAEFTPPYLAVLHQEKVSELQSLLPAGYHPQIFVGKQGYEALAALPQAHVVLSAQVGAAGLYGTWAAVAAGKVVALANKESLVLAGALIRKQAALSGAVLLPVDSEHNALFQCLCGHAPHTVNRLILTASGGPFRGWNEAAIAGVTPEQALKHPNWTMGAKITIDSATLMNKGLEFIEAHYLFGVPATHIDVVVHKESIVHSLVEFHDGSQLAQLGIPDMRVAIAYALGYPERLDTGVPTLTLSKVGTLTFEPPSDALFPCLDLARMALEYGKGAPVVLNAANEVAVEAFLQKKISFPAIAATVSKTVKQYVATAGLQEPATVEEVLMLDEQARVSASMKC